MEKEEIFFEFKNPLSGRIYLFLDRIFKQCLGDFYFDMYC